MEPELWLRVEDVCQRALELDEDQRAEFLQASCGQDEVLRREVDSLLAHASRARDFIETSALGVAGRLAAQVDGAQPTQSGETHPSAFESASMIGRRLGSYQILELIGSGGMGEVYRAVRADDQYQKQVAIKLVRAGQDAQSVVSHFRNERQILANLDHPNIARLLDGGSTDSGLPYFVMELIEGEPIDKYCDRQRLTTTERLQLFLEVCAAVQFAHQRLVIHRDIKPGNILVTVDGTPKLLDFGIAKIVNAAETLDSSQTTVTLFRALTPGYASPEQIKGEPVTTASDVYSLGVVLYELLTGHRPYPVSRLTPQEIARAVCETEPEKPSIAVTRSEAIDIKPERAAITPTGISEVRDGSPEKLRKRLSGDLDNILLMVLRKEPGRRYGSVEQFQEDIRRHLEHLPVIARKDTVRYLTAKFVRRHRAGTAAAAVVAATVLLALAVTLREARIARADRARAESRFNDVRELSHALLFPIDDAIKKVPGTTQARQLVVSSAQLYLDRLSQEGGNDLSLLRELATGYERLASIQGDPRGPNLGETKSAIESFRKAVSLREAILRASPTDLEAQHELQQSYDNLGFAYAAIDHGLAASYFQKSMGIAATLVSKEPANDVFLDALALCYEHRAMLDYDQNDFSSALKDQQEDLKLQQQLEDRAPSEEFRTHLSYAHKRVGALLILNHQYPQALAEYQAALALDKALLSAHPDDPQLRYSISLTLSDMGFIYNKQGNPTAALENYLDVLKMRQALVDADPHDERARRGLANTCDQLGNILRQENKPRAALAYNLRELANISSLLAANPGDSEARVNLADVRDDLGNDYMGIAETTADHKEKMRLLRLAQSCFGQSLPAFEDAKAKGLLLGNQRDAPQLVSEDLARNKKAIQAESSGAR